jgi:hypothetical protein
MGVYPDPAAALAAVEVAGAACAVRDIGCETAGVGSTGQRNSLGEGNGWCFVAKGLASVAWQRAGSRHGPSVGQLCWSGRRQIGRTQLTAKRHLAGIIVRGCRDKARPGLAAAVARRGRRDCWTVGRRQVVLKPMASSTSPSALPSTDPQ